MKIFRKLIATGLAFVALAGAAPLAGPNNNSRDSAVSVEPNRKYLNFTGTPSLNASEIFKPVGGTNTTDNKKTKTTGASTVEISGEEVAISAMLERVLDAELAKTLGGGGEEGQPYVVVLRGEHAVRYYPDETNVTRAQQYPEEEAYSEFDRGRPVRLPAEYFADEEADRLRDAAAAQDAANVARVARLRAQYSVPNVEEELAAYERERNATLDAGAVSAQGTFDDLEHRFNIDKPTLVFLARMGRYAQISYCVESIEDIEYPFICRLGCTQFPHTTLLLQWYEHGIFGRPVAGYMAVDSKRQEIVVMFRGTLFPSDLANSWNLLQTRFAPAPYTMPAAEWRANWAAKCGDCKVQTSLYNAYLRTMSYVAGPLEDARKSFPGYRIVIGGHNLGGMMANLAAVDLRVRGYDVTVVTFGASKFGNAAMSQFVEHLFGQDTKEEPGFLLENNRYFRVTRKSDPFTHWPYMRAYTHTMGEVYISDDLLPTPGTDVTYFCFGRNSKFCSYGDRVDIETLLLAWDAHYYYFVQFAGCATLHSYIPVYDLLPPAHDDDPY